MRKNNKRVRPPRRVIAPKLSSVFRLVIGNKEITDMGPAAKISIVKARLAANKRRA